MSKPLDCVITTLAPVHLGADEVYEPLGFVIDEDNQRLVAFEPWSFLEKLQDRDRQEFAKLCQKGTVTSLLEIYRFFRERRRHARGRAVDVCAGLVKHYQGVMQTAPRDIEIKKALNQFTIHRTAFLAHDQRPYIPGSAIKGALRTAYLNALAKLKPMDNTPRDDRGKLSSRALENRLLNYQRIDEDPFRLLKVSDFRPVGEVRTRIVYAVNEKKKPSPQFPEARGPYQILEVIEPGAAFTGTITVEQLPPEVRDLAKITTFLDENGLWSSARDFYKTEKDREEQELNELGIKTATSAAPDNCVPLRLGRHSGAESVTIAGHRHIKILLERGNSKVLNHATTLWLAADFHQRDQRQAANLRPMGWAALGEVRGEARAELAAREEAWRQQLAAGRLAAAEAEAGEKAAPAADRQPAVPKDPAREVWDQAMLTWDPGSATLTASWGGQKAFLKGKGQVREVLPEALHKKVLDKKKATPARVTVDPDNFHIVAIETL